MLDRGGKTIRITTKFSFRFLAASNRNRNPVYVGASPTPPTILTGDGGISIRAGTQKAEPVLYARLAQLARAEYSKYLSCVGSSPTVRTNF